MAYWRCSGPVHGRGRVHNPQTECCQTMKTRLAPLLLIALFLTGTGMTCRKLDPAGVYQGNQFLFEADMAITTSYDVVHTFVKWELENRQVLAVKWPEIGKAAVRLRKNYKGWHTSALALRDAYEASPTDENRNNLAASITLLRQALAEATKHMSTAARPVP